MFTNNETDQGPVECRICHSKTTRDLILSPCLCKGSMGCVHIRCLEQWLNISSHNFCELCSYRFEVIQVRRYSLLKSIRVWVCQDQGSLYKAIFFIVLSATNSFLLSWMWFLWLTNIPATFINGKEKKDEDIQDPESQDISRPKWMAVFVFLTLLTLFSIKSLCFDGYRAIKSQYYAWHRWWNETVNVQLVLDLENYKIKNKLEESKDISLKYVREKTNSLKFVDPPNEDNVNKFSIDIPEVHGARKSSTDSITDLNTQQPDLEIKINNIPGRSLEELENKVLVMSLFSSEETTNNASPEDVLHETGDPNQIPTVMPAVHKKMTRSTEEV